MNISRFDNFLNEGRSKLDGTSSGIVKSIMNKWTSDWKSGNLEKVDRYDMSTYSEAIEKYLTFDIEARLFFTDAVKGFEVLQTTGANTLEEDGEDSFILIDFGINPEWLPEYWSELYMILSDVIRHEIEHITQGGVNYKKGKPKDDDTEQRREIIKNKQRYKYLLLPVEIDANLQGLRFEAKKRKENIKNTINRYLDTQNFQPHEKEEILTKWRERAKKIGGIPEF